MSLRSTESLTPLETLAAIICESGGGRFLRFERVKGRPALVLFCAANVPHDSQTPVALPITELSTYSVRESLLASLQGYSDRVQRLKQPALNRGEFQEGE
jgi:hypothetical protein